MSETPWANSPIHKMIKDAGLDKAPASEADSTSETPRLGYCMNPRSISAKPQPIASVLRQIASGENCDGAPYDQMQQAGDYIEQLERELAQAQKRLINAEQAIREFVAIAEDMSNGKDVGNRLIVAWDVADEILEDNEREQP